MTQPVEHLHKLADEFLFEKAPALAERFPTETRDLLRSFCHFMIAKNVAVPGTPPGPEGPKGVEGETPFVPHVQTGEGHPHQVESHTLEDLDEEFRKP